nr:Uncharacterised protein [Raoultella sp. NCTC 9187]
MAAGMEVKQRQPQLLAAGQLINKGFTGFFQRLFDRVAEVDQIAIVRQDLPGSETVFFAGGFEFSNGFVAQRRGAPLALVLGEEGEAVAPISAARMAALATPPEALTCAPIYFIKKLQLSRCGVGNDSGLTEELHQRMIWSGCLRSGHQGVNRQVNRAAADNQPDEKH